MDPVEVGDLVRHTEYGIGVVRDIRGEPGRRDEVATVAWDMCFGGAHRSEVRAVELVIIPYRIARRATAAWQAPPPKVKKERRRSEGARAFARSKLARRMAADPRLAAKVSTRQVHVCRAAELDTRAHTIDHQEQLLQQRVWRQQQREQTYMASLSHAALTSMHRQQQQLAAELQSARQMQEKAATAEATAQHTLRLAATERRRAAEDRERVAAEEKAARQAAMRAQNATVSNNRLSMAAYREKREREQAEQAGCAHHAQESAHHAQESERRVYASMQARVAERVEREWLMSPDSEAFVAELQS
jgi:hypothetical protein